MNIVEEVEDFIKRHKEQKELQNEIERLREALHQIRFRIDNMPKDMSLTPNSAIFDLIRNLTIMGLGENHQ